MGDVDLHLTAVSEWLIMNGLIPTGSENGRFPDSLDVELRFAKQHFTDEKLRSLPPEIAVLLHSNEVTHLDAKRIFSYLEQVEGQGKATNVFGIFNSEALKSWWTLMRSWEKDNFHINQAVSNLAKKVGSEAPSIARKLHAAEKAMRTIDSRYVQYVRRCELWRCSFGWSSSFVVFVLRLTFDVYYIQANRIAASITELRQGVL